VHEYISKGGITHNWCWWVHSGCTSV